MSGSPLGFRAMVLLLSLWPFLAKNEELVSVAEVAHPLDNVTSSSSSTDNVATSIPFSMSDARDSYPSTETSKDIYETPSFSQAALQTSQAGDGATHYTITDDTVQEDIAQSTTREMDTPAEAPSDPPSSSYPPVGTTLPVSVPVSDGFTTASLSASTVEPMNATDGIIQTTMIWIPEPIQTTPEEPITTNPILNSATAVPSITLSSAVASDPERDMTVLHTTAFSSEVQTRSQEPARTTVNKPNLLWIAIVCILLLIIIVGMICCFVHLIKRSRDHRKQSYGIGYMNGGSQRSKKKKGGENDAWAGPVLLGGREREDGEGADERGQAEDNMDCRTDHVLTTFTATLTEGERCGPDGGVGGPGTKEVKKWEELEPLLYIDEEVGKEPLLTTSPTPAMSEQDTHSGESDPRERSKAEMVEVKGEKENVEDGEEEETVKAQTKRETNGGEAFCLTTAV